MATFTIGEEIIYDDMRFVVAGIQGDDPVRYRLLATTEEGARIVWARHGDLQKIRSYTEPKDDTAAA